MKKHGEILIESGAKKGVVYFYNRKQQTPKLADLSVEESQKDVKQVTVDVPLLLPAVTSASLLVKEEKKDNNGTDVVASYAPYKHIIEPEELGLSDEDVSISTLSEIFVEEKGLDPEVKRKLMVNRHSRLMALSKMFATAAMAITLIVYGPRIYYTTMQAVGINVDTSFRDETIVVDATEDESVADSTYWPAIDENLPKENKLIVKTAGIETTIWEASEENMEDALRKGAWRDSIYSTPDEQSVPTVLIAHRYGYLAWSIPFRLKNSFYNLPKLKVGDRVEVIWNQRKYVYIVYAEEITDVPKISGADLVLYTCNDLNSDIRIFKYAKLIEL